MATTRLKPSPRTPVPSPQRSMAVATCRSRRLEARAQHTGSDSKDRPRSERKRRVRRPHCLDAHLLTGEDVDRRSHCAPEAARPSPHAVQRELPWASLDMDFMNLNQSAHGDREFGFIMSRLRMSRKIVVGHWQDPIGCSRRLARGVRAAAAWHDGRPPGSPLRRQHARGRGDRGRQGFGPAALRLLRQRLRRRRPGRSVYVTWPTRRRCAGRRV